MIVLIDGHPSLNVEFYIRKLIDDNIGISHMINKKNLNITNPSLISNINNLLSINKCCNMINNNEVYLHNISPYTYKNFYCKTNDTIEKMFIYLWKPDIIIYLFTSSINTNDEINLKYDIVYDDMICNHSLYKINCDDEPHIIYSTICSIIKNNLIK
jgi:hypothetical protein